MSFYGVAMPKIIQNAGKSRESEKKVADGIIQSAMLTPFQRGAIDGINQSGMPKAEGVTAVMKSKAPKTKQATGFVHFPGILFA